MFINTDLAEEIKKKSKSTHFFPVYSEEIRIKIAILKKNHDLSLSEIATYIETEYGFKISRSTIDNIAKKTIKILDEKVKTEKNVKTHFWYPFYSKSPMKNNFLENSEPEDIGSKNNDLGYREKREDLVVFSGEEREENSPGVPEEETENSKDQEKKEEISQLQKAEKEVKTSSPRKPKEEKTVSLGTKKEEKSNKEIEKESPAEDKTKEGKKPPVKKTKKRTSAPRKPPTDGKDDLGYNSIEKQKQDDNPRKEPEVIDILDNDNEYKKDIIDEDPDEDAIECEIIGRSAEDMEEIREKLRRKERRRRNKRAGEMQRKKAANGGTLPMKEMKELYNLVKINPKEVSEEVEAVVDAQIKEMK